MTHDLTDPEILTIAERVCTPNELHVLELVRLGIGVRRGPRLLGISEGAWRWRRTNAIRKITAELRSEAA